MISEVYFDTDNIDPISVTLCQTLGEIFDVNPKETQFDLEEYLPLDELDRLIRTSNPKTRFCSRFVYGPLEIITTDRDSIVIIATDTFNPKNWHPNDFPPEGDWCCHLEIPEPPHDPYPG